MTKWNIRIDTGGTFTDCIASDPEGNIHKLKVLSNSALRGRIEEQLSPTEFKIKSAWGAPDGFVNGFAFAILGKRHVKCCVTQFDAKDCLLSIDKPISATEMYKHLTFEVRSEEEAPVLASRLVTQTLSSHPLPPLNMRLATTRGTNALLEKKGAPTLLLITKGFRDLLLIGDQKRPDLFAMQIEKASPLYNQVLEVEERMDAEGKVFISLNFNNIEENIKKFLKRDHAAVAICLMHSYKNPGHEHRLSRWLRQLGATYISVSSELSPFIRMLPRAQTALVNAYLQPVLNDYLQAVGSAVHNTNSLHVMTSAGGIVSASSFHPKDSLLSGPAGGVVGASAIGKQAGFNKIISFDMGGTSTDVSRYNNGFDYIFDHTVGDARLKAPALSIETVAAGGGSICSFDGQKLVVGPESAGADPGPACYGAGGPLTITDINLLLGRLDPANFGIPVIVGSAQKKLDILLKNIQDSTGDKPQKAKILEGFIQIANERMADAIRKISLRKGYAPSEHVLVAFGGSGGQHACAIADQLSINRVLIPADAGLLSAYGLGEAVVEQFAEQQILEPLAEIRSSLTSIMRKLEHKAKEKLKRELPSDSKIQIRRRLIYIRFQDQDSTLEINDPNFDHLEEVFRETYENCYGHWIKDRTIEIESIRVVASTKQIEYKEPVEAAVSETPHPIKNTKVQLRQKMCGTSVYNRNDLRYGQSIEGPVLILDPYSTILVEYGWKMKVRTDLTLELLKVKKINKRNSPTYSETVDLELFTNRFTSIAEEMGEMLQRIALSVNIKERLDFSCALLNDAGELIVNAPHIPVHLGALGVCVRRLKESISMNPGDVAVTNHPAFGGSHLPDITVVTPIYTKRDQLIGYATNRAHHSEIGGTRSGSMPPNAHSLAEEGVLIPPMYLIHAGKEQWEKVRNHLISAKYPTRSIEENMADLRAAVAANHRGSEALKTLAGNTGIAQVRFYMSKIKRQTSTRVRKMLSEIPDGIYSSEEFLDDGTPLKVSLNKRDDTIKFNFDGTGNTHPGNLNATPAIVNSVVMYVLRLLLDEPIPLNEGLLGPVTIHLPESLLNPVFPEDPEQCPAVAGGNTETSQRLVDLLLKPFKRVACSQGTMNNVLFGNESFGYYETIGGGTGAGPGFDGADAVHHHMTNTAGTDPEILEQRYPVRLDQYAIRIRSGGSGTHRGGSGIKRKLTFLKPVSLSVLTQHRKKSPYGLAGGKPGARGKQYIIRKNGLKENLGSIDGKELKPGDQLILLTPGGGGFGTDTI